LSAAGAGIACALIVVEKLRTPKGDLADLFAGTLEAGEAVGAGGGV